MSTPQQGSSKGDVNKVACGSCRSRKVKCLTGPSGASERCMACTKLDLVCAFSAHKRGRPLGSKTKAAKVKYPASSQDSSPAIDTAPETDIAPQLRAPLALFTGSAPPHPHKADNLYRWQPYKVFCPRHDNGVLLDPLLNSVCSVEEAEALFAFFFTHLQTYAGFLDVHLHTVEFVRGRSALLLSAILLAAARHDTTNPAARGIAERSKEHIDTVVWPAVLLSSHRSIQAVQGCMLLASWRAGNGRRDEDSSWTLFGHALRMAVEIGLQRPVRRLEPNDPGEPLIRDAQRCWMTLWLADASWAAQTGRASLIALDSKVQQPPEWLESAICSPEERSIVALIEYRSILTNLRSAEQTTLPAKMLTDWREKWVHPGNGGRISNVGGIYARYGQLLLLGARLSKGVAELASVTFEEAAHLVREAVELPREVLLHAHDNCHTMIQYAAQMVYHLRASAPSPSVALSALSSLHALYPLLFHAGSTPSHKDGLSHLYGQRLVKLLQAWERELDGEDVEELVLEQQPRYEPAAHDGLFSLETNFPASTQFEDFFEQGEMEGFEGAGEWLTFEGLPNMYGPQ